MNDGSELAELHALNEFDIQHIKTKLKLARAQRTDAYNQLRQSFALLSECRDLFEITALESPLRKDILELISKIDTFKGD